MRRIVLGLAVCAALLTPVASEAAVIQCFDPTTASCKPIGIFTWDQPFDDVFTVFNLSDGPDAPTAGGSFTDLVVTLDPDGPIATMNLVSLAAGGPPLDSLGAGFFFGVSEADLAFNFLSSPFAISLSGPDARSIYAEVVPVPEPSSLFLFSVGAIAMRRLRGRR